MTSYNYRDARRHTIIEALAALNNQQPDLQNVLKAEQAALQTDDWTVSDETFKAVAEDWFWGSLSDFKERIDKDPVMLALGISSTLTPAQVIALRNTGLPLSPGGPPSNYLGKLLTAVDGNEVTLSEIVHAAHQSWLMSEEADTRYPFDDVGVLLPVRIETLFDKPASAHNEDTGHWKLSLRVIPDEASVCRDNAFVSDDETKALSTFWKQIKQSGNVSDLWLEGELTEIAWKQLSARIRPERAAWLIANLPVHGDDMEIVMPEGMPKAPVPNRVGGIPPEILIFAVTTELINGTDHHLIGRLPEDKDKKIDTKALTLPLPFKKIKENKVDIKVEDSWWVSWDKAKKVGLGGEFFLPAGITPQNIEALYVIGIGEETPDGHFTAQSVAGELSIPRLGVPTNTIQGKNTMDSPDWLKVAQVRLRNRLNPPVNIEINTGAKLQQHITGKPDSIPYFMGSDATDDTLLSQRMTAALWPALWGHGLQEIWGMGKTAHYRGLWAFEHLCPEGPLMPIRIGDQPYGLLPATSLKLWEAPASVSPGMADQRAMEMEMTVELNIQRIKFANSARGKRSVVNKTTPEFMNLLGQNGRTNNYFRRNFQKYDSHLPIYQLNAAQQQEFRDRSIKAYSAAISLMGREPSEIYLANSFGQKVRLPLLQSTHTLLFYREGVPRKPLPLHQLISILINFPEEDLENYNLEKIFHRSWEFEGEEGEFQLGWLPDSLFVRLLVYACQTGYISHRADPANPLLQRVLDVQQKEAINLSQSIDCEPWRSRTTSSLNGQDVFTSLIPEALRKVWERAFTATLDSAAHRIDPWITGFAWQRLKLNSASSRHHHRLGVYGWVDGPFNGVPGPTESGLLHAPSYNQALTGLIMRDKFLSSRRSDIKNGIGENPWQMDITSEKVRIAEEIAEEVRMGCHIYEVIGRRVENIIGKRQTVIELRTNPSYSIYPVRNDPNQVCHGEKALKGLLSDDPPFPIKKGWAKKLQLLKDSLNTYSDLLMADGVLQIVNRQVDRAAETMEAAAGQSHPPNFEFIRTPPSGYQLETVVLSALPFVPIESLADKSHPIRLADPSVAAFVESKFGNNWTWSAVNTDDGEAVLGSVGLDKLGFSQIDVLFLPDEFMCELVRYKLGLPLVFISESENREWKAIVPENSLRISMAELDMLPEEFGKKSEQEKEDLLRQKMRVSNEVKIEEVRPDDLHLWIAKDEKGKLIGMANKKSLGGLLPEEKKLHATIRRYLDVPQVLIKPPRELELAQQLVATLGNRPASGRDLSKNKSAPVKTDTKIYKELFKRYKLLYKACNKLNKDIGGAANDEERVKLLRRSLPWGVIPASDPHARETLIRTLAGLPLSDENMPLTTLLELTASSLKERLKTSVHYDLFIKANKMNVSLENYASLRERNIPDGVSTLARAIANLASPNTGIAILACWKKSAIARNTELTSGQVEDLNENWLTIMASVRPFLARLEAIQLELIDPLISWTNSPNDPWRTGVVQENLHTRKSGKGVVKIKMPRFVAAYGSTTTWDEDKIAVGMIDAFNEAIPMPERKTMSAFGFNAPSARAQQAILLAVPPKPRQRLDPNLIFEITKETRELAHARMARIEDLGNLQALTPMMWLQLSGPGGVRLEPEPLFRI